MKRRTLLAVTGAATLPTVAGCLSDDDPGDNETDEPDEESEPNRRPLFADSFSATNRGGFLAIGEAVDTRSAARDAGFVLPDGEESLTLDAEVSEDGSWESTAAELPTVQIDDPITTDVSLELPDGLGGSISEDEMTASGTLEVTIERTGAQFSFDINPTSGNSGDLAGETNFESEPLTATVVDNEFQIEEDTGNILIDEFLGLPAEEAGTNWFEIGLELTGN